jgi:hypothetical protein
MTERSDRMDITRHLEHDHKQIHSLGEDILKSADGEGVGGRDNQFDYLDLQLRRHLAVIEDVLFPPLKKSTDAKAALGDIQTAHKELRKALSTLDRKDKGSHEWTAELRNLLERFDAVAKRHEAIAARAQAAEAQSGRTDLADRYERAKIKRLQGGHWSWNKVGMGVAGMAGAAAMAGAAYAANRWYKSGRRREGRSEDDFELRLETDETLRLISSRKVEGTPVVGRDGARLGTIQSFMVDKYSGRVAYAIMTFGGAPGILGGFGASLFPLPWPLLDYDEENDGYGLDISKEELAAAPRFEPNEEPEFTPEYRREILIFYRPSDLMASTAAEERGTEREGTERRESAPNPAEPAAAI